VIITAHIPRRIRPRLSRVCIHLVLVVIVLIILVPFFWMVSTSLKSLSEAVEVPPTLIPHHFRFRNYVDAWHSAPFARYFINSFAVALGTAFATVVVAAMAGFTLIRTALLGRRLILGLVLASFMIPLEATFIPNFVIITHLHWYDSYQALIVPWIGGAFSIFLFRQAYAALPPDLLEAAQIDGCTEWKLFRLVALPLGRSTALTVFVLAYLWSWNALLWPIIVTSSPQMSVIQLGLVHFQQEGGVYINLLMAAVTLSIIPVLIVFLAAQRFLIEGVTKGAIRG
jgi:multiple sugar transport system permease protein